MQAGGRRGWRGWRTAGLIWCVCLAAALRPGVLPGQAPALLVLANDVPPRVFGGETQIVDVRLRNPAGRRVEVGGRLQLVQTSSSLAAPWTSMEWKPLSVQAGQTVTESARVPFPVVGSATRFLVRWGVTDGRWLGATEVWVYPRDLLSALPRIAAGPVGLLDPHHEVRPLLEGVGAELVDLERQPLETFDGRLAIVGPFSTASQMPPNLARTAERRALAGLAIVWIGPPAAADPTISSEPGSYLVPAGRGAIVVVAGDRIARLRERPEAQLNLIRFARLALRLDELKTPKSEL